MWIAVLLIVIVLLALLYLDTRKPTAFPPGPAWIPIVGSALEVRKVRAKTGYLYRTCDQLERTYQGNGVLGLRVGKDRIVVVCGLEAMREMLHNEDLDGRPKGLFYETRTWGERRGIIMTDEQVWKEQRRFTMKHLKEFGFGRKGMAEIARTEAEYMLRDMCDALAAGSGSSAIVRMHDFFNTYVLNTLWAMMAGIRYSANDSEMKNLQALLFELFAGIDMVGTVFSHFPLLRYIAPRSSGYRWFVDIHARVWTFLRYELERHKKTFDPSKEDRDFMDVYLRELLSPAPDKDSYSEGQLVAICMDMFMAGTETTSKSLGFGFLYLVREPEVQRKAQAEIDAVIGKERLVTLDDKVNMPYNEAVSLECIRHFMGRTFGIPHRSLRNTNLAGYTIPKDAMVIPNFNCVLMSDEHFEEPYAFKPERFLVNGKGPLIVPDKYFPFGLGKHRCLGESLARCNIFIFTVTLLQHFDFMVPPGEDKPSTDNIDGATPSAAPYRALVRSRELLHNTF